MNQALWIAKTGLDAQQTKMSNIANNLANAGTTGYKRSRAIFADMLYQNVRQVGAQSSQDTLLPSGLMLGTGVRTVATEKLFTQGNLQQTDNQLDMAIQGRGFFEILLPDGSQAYSRDGTFMMDDQGQLVTASGFQLQPNITIP
ncbi:MAG: flagellar hook-basal body complex protein, partial [Halioglobus sp.]|nr:flagellar hook-basal body complex protein [Halioglobus sp.]